MAAYLFTMLRHAVPALCTALTLLPQAAAAHPHIFVQTGLRVEVSESGQITAIEVSWRYDELYSLLMFEDLKLDSDYDGRLRPDELTFLHGFDMNWDAGFEGDLYVTHEGQPVALGPPEPLETTVDNGQITTRHRRTLQVPASGTLIEAYDPTFYTAYELVGDVSISGTCQTEVTPADLNTAYAKLEEMLYGMSQQEADEAFPEVGSEFADKVRITCRD